MRLIWRTAGFLVGFLILVGAPLNNFLGEQPDYRAGGIAVMGVIGALIGCSIAWWIQRRKEETLLLKHIVGSGALGGAALFLIFALAVGAGSFASVLGMGLGRGAAYGGGLALIVYGIRGRVSGEEQDEQSQEA